MPEQSVGDRRPTAPLPGRSASPTRLGASQLLLATPASGDSSPVIIDLHCHYAFAALRASSIERFSFEPQVAVRAGQPAHPTEYDSCLSPRLRRRLVWRAARRWLGLPETDRELDQRLGDHYERHLGPAGPVERFVLLAFDAARDERGECPPLPGPGDRFGSDLYTSNSLVRDACRRRADRFLFGASVHPYRPEAVACVEEVFAGGACLLKWMPLHQNIDIRDPRTLGVLRKCAQLGLPLLVHYGPEFSLATQCPQYRSVRPLLEVLRGLRAEGQMPCVIVAHVATPVMPLGDQDSHRALLDALTGEFADAPLYADLAALATWTKAGFLSRLARRQELHHKLLFGSDFPIPPGLARLRWKLGRNYRQIAAVQSWPQQAALAVRCLGFNEIVLHRAAELLPNLRYFDQPATG